MAHSYKENNKTTKTTNAQSRGGLGMEVDRELTLPNQELYVFLPEFVQVGDNMAPKLPNLEPTRLPETPS